MTADASSTDLPDRLCTWCKVLMRKRLVASGQFIHYTCPKCIFQHTMRRMKMAKANTDGQPGVVLAYKAPVKPAVAKKRMPVPQREQIAAAR